MILFLSSCATQQDLVDLQRQLQTTRGELATVRKQVAETKTSVEGQIRASHIEQKESLARVGEQMSTVLSTVEAQQKAIASLNSFVQEGLSAIDERSYERLRKFEERISQREKGYLGSQGNLGTRLEELGAEVKIIQGKLEENNNLLAEQGARFDELNQQAARSGSRMDAAEGNLKSAREAQASYEEKSRVWEGKVASLLKSWEAWREQADRALRHVEEIGKRLGELEAEVRTLKESSAKSVPPASPAGLKGKEEEKTVSPPAPAGKETADSGEGIPPASSPGGDEIYKAAYGDYSRGAYDLGISGFRDYLAKYPKGSLAANAQYWVGECYYSQKEFKEAIAEFEAVLKNYPKSEKAADALLKKAFCYHELKDPATEKAILNEVLEKYPKAEAARMAKTRLGNLR